MGNNNSKEKNNNGRKIAIALLLLLSLGGVGLYQLFSAPAPEAEMTQAMASATEPASVTLEDEALPAAAKPQTAVIQDEALPAASQPVLTPAAGADVTVLAAAVTAPAAAPAAIFQTVEAGNAITKITGEAVAVQTDDEPSEPEMPTAPAIIGDVITTPVQPSAPVATPSDPAEPATTPTDAAVSTPSDPAEPVTTPTDAAVLTPSDTAKSEAYAALDYLASLIKANGSIADKYFQNNSRKNDTNTTLDNGGPNFGKKIDGAMDATTTDAIDADDDGFLWTMARDSANDKSGNFDFAIYWYGKGAKAGDTVDNAFRYKGNTGDAENNVEGNTDKGSVEVADKVVDGKTFQVIVEGSFTETSGDPAAEN